MNLESRRNALVLTLGWWLFRRRLRKRAETAVAGLLAGEGFSLGAHPRKRRGVRGVVVLVALAGGSYLAWRRLRGGGDDWGTWEPEPDAPVPPSEPARAPQPDPVAA